MMIPTIHLGGTSRATLLDELDRARHLLRAAIDALEDIEPHARDYSPQGPTAIRVATYEHAQRVNALQGVLNELQTIHEAIANGSKP
jgi:hypothetical protein